MQTCLTIRMNKQKAKLKCKHTTLIKHMNINYSYDLFTEMMENQVLSYESSTTLRNFGVR